MKRLRQYLCVLLFIYIACVVSGAKKEEDNNRNEDDDIINEVLSTEPHQKKRNGVPYDYTYHPLSPRTDTPGAKRSNSGATMNIAKDVNKYGLWEYTADNTGMGQQLKSIMSKVHNKEIDDAVDSHALEKTANKMNAEINKYIDGADPSPTIDPMETPEGYQPTTHQAQFSGPDSSPINHGNNGMDNVDVVTIPNSMTIEDEHGNNLDSVQTKSFNVGIKPTGKATRVVDEKWPSYSKVIQKPTASSLGLKPKPTTPLLNKLLRTLKTNPAFRATAQSLLPAAGDSEEVALKKQEKLSYFIKTFEEMQENTQAKLKKKIPRYIGGQDVSSISTVPLTTDSESKTAEAVLDSKPDKSIEGVPKDTKLLTVVKNLMKTDKDDPSQRNQLHALLSALKTSEKNAGKMEEEFYDTTPKEESKEETSQSDARLQHFKEFLEKHKHEQQQQKQQQLATSNDLDHPLGTSGASPLMGYLEQESAAVNDIKDAGVDPKLEFERLEQMLQKQKIDQEAMQKEHDKILIEQFKALLKQDKDNKKEGEKSATVIEEGEKNNSPDIPHDKSFTEAVYNVLKESKDFQEFAAKQGTTLQDAIMEIESNKEHTPKEFVHKESSPKEDATADTSSGAGEDDKNVEKELEEIQKQKDELLKKEEKLKSWSKTKELKAIKEIKDEKQVKDNEERKNVDHLLHLASPKKHNTTKDDEDTIGAFQKVHRPKWRKLSDKTKSSSENDKIKTTNETKKENEDNEIKKVSNNLEKPKDNATSDTSTSSELKQKSKKHHDDKTSSNLVSSHELDSEEQYKVVDMHQDALKTESKSNDVDDTDRPKHDSKIDVTEKTTHTEENDDEDESKVDSKTLGLPINNPAPLDDNGIEPHENFHHTFHTHVKNKESESNRIDDGFGIAPIPSPIRLHNHHLASPSIMNGDASLPPAGQGKPSASKHHVYPIMEPPQLISFHTHTNHHLLTSNIDDGNDATPNTVENLLKHKIPKVTDGEDASFTHSPPGSLHLTPYARIIKPKSSHRIIDVTASKKSFGNPPKKPKSYLLKELRQKLKLFAEKRNRMKHFLHSHKKHNTSVPTLNSTSLKTILNTLTNLTRNKTNMELSHRNGIVVPSHINHRMITIDNPKTSNMVNESNKIPKQSVNETVKNNTTKTVKTIKPHQRNVIIPGSVASQFYEKPYKVDVSKLGVDPSDITRSSLPKVVRGSTGEKHLSVEDVFNILGSEDQVNS